LNPYSCGHIDAAARIPKELTCPRYFGPRES
jgi:hypothetical protein